MSHNIIQKNHTTIIDSYGAFFFVFFQYINLLALFALYIPSTYVIEKYGVNKAVLGGTAMTAIGAWIGYGNVYTLATFFISLGTPFAVNAATKVASSWYGPKGRTVATTLILIAMYLGPTIDEFVEEKIIPGLFAISVILSLLTPFVGLLLYDKPDFSPTMSEEDKYDYNFDLKKHFKMMIMNKSFLNIAVSAGLLLIIIN